MTAKGGRTRSFLQHLCRPLQSSPCNLGLVHVTDQPPKIIIHCRLFPPFYSYSGQKVVGVVQVQESHQPPFVFAQGRKISYRKFEPTFT